MYYRIIFVVLLASSVMFNAEAKSLSTPSQQSNEDIAREKLLTFLAGDWIARGIYVATKLEIADYLLNGPKSAEELASLSQSNPDALNRLLRLLSSIGIFDELDEGVYGNNAISLMLSKNNSSSLNALIKLYGEEIHTSFDQLLASVKSGTPAFDLHYKQPVFQYFKDHPDTAMLFQQAMREKSKGVIQSAVNAYDFSRFQKVYDIGGGHGHFLLALLKHYPKMKGGLFDLPEVIAINSKNNPQLKNERVELIAGDFFASIPKGADAYLLKSVLHDWDDEKSHKILKNCHEAMSAESRLLIVEVVLLPKHESVYAKCVDVLMLNVVGGKERTLSSFEQLLHRAGFTLVGVYPTSTEFSILEARKK